MRQQFWRSWQKSNWRRKMHQPKLRKKNTGHCIGNKPVWNTALCSIESVFRNPQERAICGVGNVSSSVECVTCEVISSFVFFFWKMYHFPHFLTRGAETETRYFVTFLSIDPQKKAPKYQQAKSFVQRLQFADPKLSISHCERWHHTKRSRNLWCGLWLPTKIFSTYHYSLRWLQRETSRKNHFWRCWCHPELCSLRLTRNQSHLRWGPLKKQNK